MAKTTIIRLICISCIALLSPFSVGQSLGELSEIEVRMRWLQEASRYAGIREKGYNKHDSIQKMNRWVGSPLYAPYCATGLAYTAHRVGLNFKVQGSRAAVRSWFAEPAKVIYQRGRQEYRGNAVVMDMVWLFESHVEGIAQARIRRDIQDDDKFMTVAFNTSGNTGGQQGVYHPVWRRWRDVRRIANHVTPYLRK